MENNIIFDLKNITVAYGDNTVLKNLNLSIHDREFITLLGPSGCGKTTTLRIIGGFDHASPSRRSPVGSNAASFLVQSCGAVAGGRF